jgi:hypothetical protein
MFLGFVAALGLLTECLGLLESIDSPGSLSNAESTRGQGRTSEQKGKDHKSSSEGPQS